MQRILYFGYYLKNLDKERFGRFVSYVQNLQKRSKISILLDVVISSFRYKISLLEYFQFRFFELNHEQRKTWAGTGFMYEYQLLMNPKNQRQILDDKTLFYKQYRGLFLHKLADLNELVSKTDLANSILSNAAGKLVFKVANGKCGAQVEFRSASEFDLKSLPAFMEKNGYDLVEEYIIQHPAIMMLSPSAVNTIRIFSQLNSNNEVELLGCRLRISVNSKVDNMAAGNMAAAIDEKTGLITGPGVYSDITKPDESIQPVTGVPIIGFQIPFWQETLDLVIKAAKAHPQNRSIGWDIVMTENGPGLIEGNHDWCKLVLQMPVKKGMKTILEKHLKEFKNR
jgi:hypothetical protein